MARRVDPLKSPTRILSRGTAPAQRLRKGVVPGKRARGTEYRRQGPAMPPEDWYEPAELETGDYRVIVQDSGEGYEHVLTPQEIRQRLSQLPPSMLKRLEVVQLSRMTRKKRCYPCYGMQWGSTVYLYPIEDSLTESYERPPKPAELREAAMFGGRWVQDGPTSWSLKWTWSAIRDYYLNNVLIHELGHIVDNRNSNYLDRERYAEWFAIEYGYRPSRAQMAQRAVRRVMRRHG